MDPLERTTFSAYVGIDWADTKHDVCIQSGIEGKREFAVIPHQPSDIDEWVQSLLRRFTAPIAIAVELSKGPIVYALQQSSPFRRQLTPDAPDFNRFQPNSRHQANKKLAASQ